MLNYEVAYLQGASFLDSTHQCVLCWSESWDQMKILSEKKKDDDDVSGIFNPHLVLYAYAINLTKSLNSYNTLVLTADIYEDEDFQNTKTPIISDISSKITDDDASKVLLAAIDGTLLAMDKLDQDEEGEESAVFLALIVEILKLRSSTQSLFEISNSFCQHSVNMIREVIRPTSESDAASAKERFENLAHSTWVRLGTFSKFGETVKTHIYRLKYILLKYHNHPNARINLDMVTRHDDGSIFSHKKPTYPIQSSSVLEGDKDEGQLSVFSFFSSAFKLHHLGNFDNRKITIGSVSSSSSPFEFLEVPFSWDFSSHFYSWHSSFNSSISTSNMQILDISV